MKAVERTGISKGIEEYKEGILACFGRRETVHNSSLSKMVRSSITGLLGGLILSSAVGAENITSDTHFYGESPPVYPSRMYSALDFFSHSH